MGIGITIPSASYAKRKKRERERRVTCSVTQQLQKTKFCVSLPKTSNTTWPLTITMNVYFTKKIACIIFTPSPKLPAFFKNKK
jgi:hypothetical protein